MRPYVIIESYESTDWRYSEDDYEIQLKGSYSSVANALKAIKRNKIDNKLYRCLMAPESLTKSVEYGSNYIRLKTSSDTTTWTVKRRAV